MLDTNLSLLLALILFIVLIVFNIIFSQFRKVDENEPEISLPQDLAQRTQGFRDQLKIMFQQFGGTINLLREDFAKSNIQEPETQPESQLQPIHPWLRFAEWGIILIVVVVYAGSYLTMSSGYRLPGSELPTIQSVGQIFTISLQQGYFPLWNPYISTGFPYFADPIMYIYNPFISVPILMFGYVQGFVYAIFLAMLIGAYGMWQLARQLNLGSPGRIWSALIFVLAGVMIIRFVQGQYLLVIGYGWLPWAVAAVFRVLRFGRGKDIAGAAIVFALLYLCGNLYYPYYLIYVGALGVIIYSVASVQRTKPFIRINWLPIRNLFLTGILTFGLVAIHLIPLIEFSPRISKGLNLDLTDSHSLPQILLDYTSKDKSRPDAIDRLPSQEFYAYVGWWPFIALLALPFAWKKGRRRSLIFILGIFILSTFWIDMRDTPWKEIYRSQPLLHQFTYPTRMLAIGTLALTLLSGFGIDYFWKYISNLRQADPKNWRGLLATVAMGAILVFMLASIGDLFVSNVATASPAEYPTTPDQVLTELHNYDPGTYYISTQSDWHEHTINYGMLYWNGIYPIGDIIRYDGMINQRGFAAAPKYRIQSTTDPAPENSTLIPEIDTFSVYKDNNSLPFSFSVPTKTLMVEVPGQPLQPGDVTDQPATMQGPNQVAVDSDNNGDPSTLVILARDYPGWQVSVDGEPGTLVNVSGYMGVPLQVGMHHYVFTFQPTSFYVGLVISIIALIIALMMLILGKWLSYPNLKLGLGIVKTRFQEYQSQRLLTSKTISATIPTIVSKTETVSKPFPKAETASKPVSKTTAAPSQIRMDDNRFLTVRGSAGETIKVDIHVDIPVGARVRFTIEALEGDGTGGEPTKIEINGMAP